MHIVTRVEVTPGPELRMDCPSCHAASAAAGTARISEREYLFNLIPVTHTKWTAITCQACNREFRIRPECDALAEMTPAQLSELVGSEGMSYVGNITKFCILISVALGILPTVGIVFGLVGIIGTRGCRTRWRTAAPVGLSISTITTAMVTVLLMTVKQK